ncbi:hypothetical protein L596_017092 [Steinernema carpocapsae]|uniref:Uncharacterized protein n=1 Tax=Steinernema carpocapsae TaxID=34508 RepID=A0A4U5N0G6_STECR|nr:hypothetical protein L596_017092 [Steinernema carpocapsae]
MVGLRLLSPSCCNRKEPSENPLKRQLLRLNLFAAVTFSGPFAGYSDTPFPSMSSPFPEEFFASVLCQNSPLNCS